VALNRGGQLLALRGGTIELDQATGGAVAAELHARTNAVTARSVPT